MKCPDCDGKGGDTYDVFGFASCRLCNGTGEWNCTNEELLRLGNKEDIVNAILYIAKDDFKELRKRYYGIANDDKDALFMWLEDKHKEK